MNNIKSIAAAIAIAAAAILAIRYLGINLPYLPS